MRVLESSITWTVVAAVLLVVAIVLIVVSSARRRRVRRAAAAAAWPPPALESGRPDPAAAWSDPATARRRPSAGSPVSNLDDVPDATATATYSDPPTDPLDVDAVRAGLAEPPAESPAESTADSAAEDTPPQAPHRPRHAATADGDPGPDTESAKDRLLAVLLGDPRAAVAALAAVDTAVDTDAGTTASDADVTALLRAGLSPSQVARLVGVDESRLAALVARRLGLFPDDQARSGTNRTDEPGRSWANAGSSAGSTTPTTG
ncbi:hypothetical protein [Actinomycetospora chibensis]|uniref:Uncharacterized protein n=1 Tax=Actinomycetospora chibensis TaxID=663606 RepID=A0ABV9RCT6_9PSEU|nr:hypothetical protein [Actinomycetospora chibensis]MDD7924016.1 hypothetical protein [Actinomycetospora chibensis]